MGYLQILCLEVAAAGEEEQHEAQWEGEVVFPMEPSVNEQASRLPWYCRLGLTLGHEL